MPCISFRSTVRLSDSEKKLNYGLEDNICPKNYTLIRHNQVLGLVKYSLPSTVINAPSSLGLEFPQRQMIALSSTSNLLPG